MREDLVDWISLCTDQLQAAYSKDDEARMLVRALVTQYELCVLQLLRKNRTGRILDQIKTRLADLHYKRKNQQRPTSFKLTSMAPNEPTDILFWPFQPMHVENIKSLYPVALKKGMRLKVFTQNPALQDGIADSEGFIQLDNLSPKRLNYKDFSIGRQLVQASKKLPRFKGVSFHEVMQLSLSSAFSWIYYTRDYFHRLMQQYQPKTIFVGNDVTYVGSTVCHLSKKAGTPTFTMMHGSIKSELWKYSNADCFFLFGEKDKATMLRRGLDASGLCISGSPKLEQKIATYKNVAGVEKIILVALSGPGHSITIEHHEQTIQLLEQMVFEYPHHQFVFKLHKKDRLFYYRNIRSFSNAEIIPYGDEHYPSDVFYWLSKAAVLITGASSTAIEAMVLGVPVITVDLLGHLSTIDYIKKDISLHTTDFMTLKKNLNAVFSQNGVLEQHLSKSKAFAQSAYAHPAEGSAALIVQRIQEYL